VDARVYRESQASELGDALLARFKTEPKSEPIVLIGFSFGGDESIKLARRLDENHVRVDLLVTIDPVTPAPIAAGIGKQLNFYQSNGALDLFPWLRGVPVEGEAGSAVHNLDIRTRDDLLEPNTGHSTIAANPKLHRVILDEVLKVCPLR
jgi:pimeloyl-ACP methyl ester carboxylesterase